MPTVADKLHKLYQLTILRPEEQSSEARQNEARNAAFLMLKLARENGYHVKFIKVSEQEPVEPVQTAVTGPRQAPAPRRQQYARYVPPTPPPKPKARVPLICTCGKPTATRTWYAPGIGCTHVS